MSNLVQNILEHYKNDQFNTSYSFISNSQTKKNNWSTKRVPYFIPLSQYYHHHHHKFHLVVFVNFY